MPLSDRLTGLTGHSAILFVDDGYTEKNAGLVSAQPIILTSCAPGVLLLKGT
jgi:hypothetical protein